MAGRPDDLWGVSPQVMARFRELYGSKQLQLANRNITYIIHLSYIYNIHLGDTINIYISISIYLPIYLSIYQFQEFEMPVTALKGYDCREHNHEPI